jgi:NADPH2:quinone reductase
MKAMVITGVGGSEVLELGDVPTPEPQGDQVRVRVRASAVNRADLMQCRGAYPAPPGAPKFIPGLEFAGEVDALGPGVTAPLQVGDRVFGIVGGGGHAEHVVTHERLAVPIPANLDFEEAAAIPEVFITAHDALTQRARLRAGERVLIQAVGSGVGSAAVQIAHAMGCTVFGTSRSAEKLERAAELGLDVGIDSTHDDVAKVVLERTGGAGVEVLLDLVGAPALAGNLAALAPKGRLILVGLLGGGTATVDLTTLLRRRITVVGTTLRARPIEEKIAATRRFAATIVPWLERGLVRPVIDRVFPLDQSRAAQARVEANVGFGKVILRI